MKVLLPSLSGYRSASLSGIFSHVGLAEFLVSTSFVILFRRRIPCVIGLFGVLFCLASAFLVDHVDILSFNTSSGLTICTFSRIP